MRKLHKRIIAGILAGVTLFFACVPPACASGLDVITSIPVDFWTFIQGSLFQGVNDFKHMFDKDVCPMSTKADGLHNFKEQRTTIDGKTTLYYICEYCGKSAGEVGEEAYQQQVSDLPASGYNSAGNLIWQVSSANLSSYFIHAYYPTTGRTLYFVSSDKLSLNDKGNGFHGSSSSGDYVRWVYPEVQISNFPVSGSYCVIESPALSGRAVSSGSVITVTADYSVGTWHHFNPTSAFSVYSSHSVDFPSSWTYFSFECYFPVFEVIPDAAIDATPGGQYSITTRPTTITGGNYGIVGDNGQITTVTNTTQIINEGDNLYYNPATGQTYTITDWTYNYDGRIYNITLDTGDKVSVEYGDENITIVENTINEGDTIVNNYTIYYMIDGTGSGDTPSPTPCPHDWQVGTSTAPTCTAPGKTVYTCSKCGETKTETVPALGHNWQVVRTVPTEYDEDGTQTQAGYTLYECTRCGEQYKDTDSTGPPGDDVDDGGLLAWLNGLIKHLSDNLSGVVALIKRFFTEIPGLFGGFTGFLAAVFPFLPEEITLLLTFGMAALVVVGVIKAIRR